MKYISLKLLLFISLFAGISFEASCAARRGGGSNVMTLAGPLVSSRPSAEDVFSDLRLHLVNPVSSGASGAFAAVGQPVDDVPEAEGVDDDSEEPQGQPQPPPASVFGAARRFREQQQGQLHPVSPGLAVALARIQERAQLEQPEPVAPVVAGQLAQPGPARGGGLLEPVVSAVRAAGNAGDQAAAVINRELTQYKRNLIIVTPIVTALAGLAGVATSLIDSKKSDGSATKVVRASFSGVKWMLGGAGISFAGLGCYHLRGVLGYLGSQFGTAWGYVRSFARSGQTAEEALGVSYDTGIVAAGAHREARGAHMAALGAQTQASIAAGLTRRTNQQFMRFNREFEEFKRLVGSRFDRSEEGQNTTLEAQQATLAHHEEEIALLREAMPLLRGIAARLKLAFPNSDAGVASLLQGVPVGLGAVVPAEEKSADAAGPEDATSSPLRTVPGIVPLAAMGMHQMFGGSMMTATRLGQILAERQRLAQQAAVAVVGAGISPADAAVVAAVSAVDAVPSRALSLGRGSGVVGSSRR